MRFLIEPVKKVKITYLILRGHFLTGVPKRAIANFGKRSNPARVGVLHQSNGVQASNWRSYATLAKVRYRSLWHSCHP
jgi:hypothetical protein